jgi:hypothetical protein
MLKNIWNMVNGDVRIKTSRILDGFYFLILKVPKLYDECYQINLTIKIVNESMFERNKKWH